MKPKADARYLQNTKTVVVTDTVADGTFGTALASCPAGWQAIGGGVDPNDVFTMQVTSSNPIIGSDRTLLTSDGTHGKATGWMGGVLNNSGGNAVFKVAVICSK